MQNEKKHMSDNQIRQNKNILLSNRGTTMLETLVAFVVLMIILGILYNIIAFCSEMRMSSADTSRALQAFNAEIYSNNADSSEKLTVQDCKTDKNKPLFFLELNTDKTSAGNLGSANVADCKEKLSMYHIEAKTYAYKKEPTDSDNIAIPKAIEFRYKE